MQKQRGTVPVRSNLQLSFNTRGVSQRDIIKHKVVFTALIAYLFVIHLATLSVAYLTYSVQCFGG